MMKRKESKSRAMLKYALLVPLIACLTGINVKISAQNPSAASSVSAKPETSSAAAAQKQQPPKPAVDVTQQQQSNVPPKISNENDDKEVFVSVEHNPEFPGGMQELYKFIAENLKYPAEAQQNGIQGKAIIRFIVEKDGSVSNVEVLRGFDANCDAEAVRVIKMLPKFKPGTQNGQVVRVYYTLPINFVLQKQDESSQTQNSQQIDNALFIVDGKEISKEEFNKIDPKTIQALNVLKNESATKLYGDKGKNGVVLITLKKP